MEYSKYCLVLFILGIAAKASVIEKELVVDEELDPSMTVSNTQLRQEIDNETIQIYRADDDRIIGAAASREYIPYQISIQKKNFNQFIHFCGGSIIDNEFVLTAAHCVDKERPERISIVAGTTRLSAGGTRHKAVWFKMHKNYKSQGTIVNDVAVIKVYPPFPINGRTVRKIDVSDPTPVKGNFPVTLTGWGSTTPNPATGAISDVLNILHYHIISNDECRRKGFKVTDGEVCAYSGYLKGACVGDSGGPLVNRDKTRQIGIVSYGSSVCAQGLPDVFANVPKYSAWIKEAIKSGKKIN